MALVWTATLKDGMSAPAKSAASALLELGARLSQTRAASAAADASFAAAGAEIIKEVAELKKLQSAAKNASDALVKLSTSQSKVKSPSAFNDGLLAQRNKLPSELSLLAAANKAAAEYEKHWGDHRRSAVSDPRFSDAALAARNAFKMPSMGGGSLASTVNISSFAKVSQAIGKTLGSGALQAFQSVTGAIANNAGTLEKVGSVLKSIGSAALMAAKAIVVVGVALAALAVKGIEAIFDATRFKDDATDGFNAVLGSSKLAQQAYDVAAKTSLDIAGDLHETMASMNTLLAQGFSVDMADSIIRAMADIKAMDPKADVQGVADAFAKIHSQGALTEKTLKKVALAAHVTTDSIAEALAKDLGKKKSEIEAMLKKGQITGPEGEKAILEAIQGKTGKKLGGAAAEANDDVYGMMSRLANLKEQMLATINVDWGPLKTALGSAFEALQGPEGQRLIRTIGSDLTRVIKALFGDLDSPAKFNAIIRSVGAGVTKFADAVIGVKSILDTVAPVFSFLSGSVDGVGSALGTLGAILGSLFTGPAGAVIQIFSTLYDVIARVGSSSSSAGASAMEIGSAIIQGIVNGIVSGASAVVDAIAEVAQSAIKSANDEFGIASPSKVFHEIGIFNMRGLVGGHNAGGADVERSMSAALDPQRVAMQAGQNVRNSSSSSTRNMTGNISIVVPGGDGAGIARHVEDTLRSLNAAFS